MAESVAFLVVLAVLAAAIIWHTVDVMWSRRLMVRRRVLVNLRSGRALTGTLWVRRGRLIVLKGAELLEPGADPMSMDGDVIVDRDQVDYVQAAS